MTTEHRPATSPAAKTTGGAAKAISASFIAAVLALAGPLIKVWEGKENRTYLDIVGVPTACYGETGKHIQVGKTYTNAQCEAFLDRSMRAHFGYVQRCIIDKAATPLTVNEAAALTSFAFNVGQGGVCGSTLQRHAIRGEKVQMCGQLMRWVYAGGRRVPGLVNRRKAEYRLCMSDK